MRRPLALIAGLALLPGCCRPDVEPVPAANPKAISQADQVEVAPGDWPWWRGPTRDNHARGPLPPTQWGESNNIRWRVALPGRGHSSPILWGERIFLTTADETRGTQSLLCFGRYSHQQLWQTEVHQGDLPPMHHTNSHASGTPACDGDRVFTAFAVDDAVWATALDFDGRIVWQKKVGPFASKHGYGASPVIYKSALIVAADHLGQGYVAALDRKSGEVLWRTLREREASFATPVVAHVAGRDQLLLSGQNRVVSYDPATGEELWRCAGTANSTANTIAWYGDHVYASGGWHQAGVLCIRADGSGDVSDTHVVWEHTMKLYVPSPAVVEDRLLVVRDDGIAFCFNAVSGERLWAKRLRGVGVSASPTIIDGDLAFVPNEKGTMFVFRAGEEFEVVAVNEFRGGGFASPVIADGRIYLRTLDELICIGEEEPPSPAVGEPEA